MKQFNPIILAIFLLLLLSKNTLLAAEIPAKTDKKIKEKKPDKGFIESGLTIMTGNSQQKSIYGNANYEKNFDKYWTNIFKGRAVNQSEKKIRSKEEYYLNNNARKNISQANFSFVELTYISDRYGGYDYRFSETMGYGRKLIDKKDLEFSTQLSGGLIQARLTDKEKLKSWIATFGSDVNWNINESLSFYEDFDLSKTSGIVITRSDSNLKIRMGKKLYLKFGFLFEQASKVPVGVKKIDTTTMIMVGFDF